MEQIFISSVQKELQTERFAIRDFVHGNDLLRQFFRVFLFEDLPPSDRKSGDVYLDEVARSPIYIGILSNEYGYENEDGVSPTEMEFNRATELRKRRLIFIKGRDDSQRAPKMKALIQRAGDELVRRRFDDVNEMQRLLYGSLIQYLQDKGFIAAKDFDAAPCTGATLQDISASRIQWFLEKARDERRYALPVDTPPERTLAHLNLLAGSVPTRGAILLFCENAERFFPSAEIMCVHYHGTEVAKPIPNQQPYRGTIFEAVDKAVDFVMGALVRSVEPGQASVSSDVKYDIPYRVVREAIVNAVAHRNYASKSGVQVVLFADRLEIWNPGGLPEDLTIDQLRHAHPSVPRNRLICEPLFLAHYIERAGTGTLDMIRLCKEAGLPEPEFRSEGERFVTVIWRDHLTPQTIAAMGLNERQKKALEYLRKHRRITNSEYQGLFSVSKRTATEDMSQLLSSGMIEKIGTTGKGVFYRLNKGAPKGHKGQ